MTPSYYLQLGGKITQNKWYKIIAKLNIIVTINLVS